ncbi:hypothetical protein FVE85_4703 [Porphyridium purpureum]|uniref:Uncharacterized protein n=1 Tax=Porphyridium purpureum TaxID=35688 RepID=A0A5J4YQL7_PORPP|nr:hypothetical protein FVE85_4703 [Porphyridium purpureum]|eukprot:POR3422..scf236_6
MQDFFSPLEGSLYSSKGCLDICLSQPPEFRTELLFSNRVSPIPTQSNRGSRHSQPKGLVIPSGTAETRRMQTVGMGPIVDGQELDAAITERTYLCRNAPLDHELNFLSGLIEEGARESPPRGTLNREQGARLLDEIKRQRERAQADLAVITREGEVCEAESRELEAALQVVNQRIENAKARYELEERLFEAREKVEVLRAHVHGLRPIDQSRSEGEAETKKHAALEAELERGNRLLNQLERHLFLVRQSAAQIESELQLYAGEEPMEDCSFLSKNP